MTMSKPGGWLFLCAGWLALLLSCAVHSFHSPMWVDELYSYNLIRDPSLAHMLAALGDQADGAMPLFYLLIRPWAALFSTHEIALRLFSSAAFCAAFALIWNTLRRAFDFWPSALALALVVGTSHVIRFENANVRFYGLFFALIALATLLTVKFGEREKPGPGLLAGNVLAQAALVLCHPLGGIYSATLLTALCAGDVLLRRRVRLAAVLSYPAGWLALLLWFRQILRQADLNHPHSWVPVPEYRELPRVLYGGSDFYPLFLLFVVLAAWRLLTPGRPAEPRAFVEGEPPFSPGACRQLIIGVALVCVPLLLWIFSRAVPDNPLFLARYVIGVSIGWTIILAQICTCLLPALRLPSDVWTKTIFCGFIALQFGVLVTGPNPDNGGLTGESDPAFGHADLPIVCLRSHDFLPREHYSPQSARYYFLLDWEVAAAPGNSRHATVEYKLLDALRRNYAAVFHQHIVDGGEFLRDHPVFLVHEIPQTSWVSMRLPPDQYTITRPEPDRTLDYTRDGVWPMLLVERKR